MVDTATVEDYDHSHAVCTDRETRRRGTSMRFLECHQKFLREAFQVTRPITLQVVQVIAPHSDCHFFDMAFDRYHEAIDPLGTRLLVSRRHRLHTLVAMLLYSWRQISIGSPSGLSTDMEYPMLSGLLLCTLAQAICYKTWHV